MSAPAIISSGTAAGGPPVGGTGTTNTIPRWTGPSTLGDSRATDDGTTFVVGSGAYAGTALPGGMQLKTTVPIYVATDGTRTTIIGTDGTTSCFVGSLTNHNFQIRASNATAITVQPAGNVGIGTASPQEKLQIYGDLKVGVLASGSFVTFADETSTQKNVGIARLAGDTGLTVAGYGGIRFYASTTQVTSQVERMRISNAGTQAQSQVAIGTSSFTTGRALTTVADLDVFGVRVGRGGDGSQTSNTALGRSALGSITTGDSCTAVGSLALQSVTGSRNTAVGYAALGAIGASTDNTALGASAIGNNTGSRNTAVGRNALNGSAGASTGSDNVCIGERAGDSITTGASNIVIGSNADLAAATDSNKLVIGDATNYVATNGGATTYYATAGALAGYIIVRLNGTDVKLPVYAL